MTALDAERPDLSDPTIAAFVLDESFCPELGLRSNTLLEILNAAGKSGWSNHEILQLGSQLAVRWGITDPERNLYQHWLKLFGQLHNVRRHYPNSNSLGGIA